MTDPWVLAGLFAAVAALYASVGHAGASGYLAVMAFAGLAPAAMRPTALALNLIVSSVASFRFYRAGLFSWALFWPFAAGSIPLALAGGALPVAEPLYRRLVGAVLLYGAARLAWKLRAARPDQAEQPGRPPRLAVSLACGAGIGLLAGLTGTGGGIFLSPLVLLLGWADARRTSALSAPFILVNSVAALAGNPASVRLIPDALPVWAVAALAGGIAGAELGARRLPPRAIRALLALVLAAAAVKLLVL